MTPLFADLEGALGIDAPSNFQMSRDEPSVRFRQQLRTWRCQCLPPLCANSGREQVQQTAFLISIAW
jgi:hypothetical protein